MIEIFWIVKDTLAGVAGDDLVVLANLLKHLGTNANLADFADVIAGRSNGNATTMLANALVSRKQVGRNGSFDFFAFFQVGLERAQIALVFLFKMLSLFVDLLLVFLQAAFSGLDLRPATVSASIMKLRISSSTFRIALCACSISC